MTSLFDIHSPVDVFSFLAWTLCVWGVSKALFRSFPLDEVRFWLTRRDQKQQDRIKHLVWEVSHGCRYDADVAAGSPHAARVALTGDEIAARKDEVDAFMARSRSYRALWYGLNCHFCHHCWAALLIYACTRGVADPAALLTSAFAYAALVSLGGEAPTALARRVAGEPHASKGGRGS